jgi:DNA-binding transcriptional ArsR family regulator
MPENQDHRERAGVTPPAALPAVGMPGNPLRLTDPRMMRALAHPARIAIWQHLGLEGPATATECAEIAGLSPSACSYHLRTLARYGFVEEDPASSTDGRERPWRVKVIAFGIPDDADTTPAMRNAAWMLSDSLHASVEELRESYRDRSAEYPADWRSALGTFYDVLHATPEELRTLQSKLIELFGEYRRLSLDERPLGARRVQVTVGLIPWFPPPPGSEDVGERE